MEKVKGVSIFYRLGSHIIYYKEKGEFTEDLPLVVPGSEVMYCQNKFNSTCWIVEIKFDHGRAILFTVEKFNYTKNQFFNSFNLVTESYYNINTSTAPKSISNEIGNYRFWKNMNTKEVLILNDRFIVQCGPNKGKDIGFEAGYKMVNIPTKIFRTATGEIVSKEVSISIKDGKLTIEWPKGSNNISFDDLDLFREHYLFIDDEDFVEEEPKVIPKNPSTEKECSKPKVGKGNELGIGNYSFWSDGNEVTVAKNYKSIHGTIHGLDVRDSFTFKRMLVPTIISPPYNVNVRLQTFDLKQVGEDLYIRINDVTFGRESTVKSFLSDGGKFIYRELETITFNGLDSYKQISSYSSLNNKADRERQRELHSIWSEDSWPTLPECVTEPMIQLYSEDKIPIKIDNKTNVELKLIQLEDEEDLMNEQVFKMKVIN